MFEYSSMFMYGVYLLVWIIVCVLWVSCFRFLCDMVFGIIGSIGVY